MLFSELVSTLGTFNSLLNSSRDLVFILVVRTATFISTGVGSVTLFTTFSRNCTGNDLTYSLVH